LTDRAEYHVLPLRTEGNTSIPPSAKQEITAFFSVPGESSPSDVRSYRVAWTVANGAAYRQRTTFVAAHWRRPYSPYDIYYDDSYYGYYGPYPWWPNYYYVWPLYPGPYYGWRYWRAPYPRGPLPPSYMRPTHR
jgi:hypothetical protein